MSGHNQLTRRNQLDGRGQEKNTAELGPGSVGPMSDRQPRPGSAHGDGETPSSVIRLFEKPVTKFAVSAAHLTRQCLAARGTRRARKDDDLGKRSRR
jgi:hypothetical protein